MLVDILKYVCCNFSKNLLFFLAVDRNGVKMLKKLILTSKQNTCLLVENTQQLCISSFPS